MATDLNAIEPSGGSLVLRGHRIEVDSDVGMTFVTDCVRFIEGLVTEEQLRKKYQLDDAGWRGLSENEELQQRVGSTKEKRIRSGEAAREKAAHLFIEAPTVLGGIMHDVAAPVRSRIEAARELRQVATPASEAALANERDRVSIRITFGAIKVHREMDLKPVRTEEELKLIERDDEDRDKLQYDAEDNGYRPTGLLNYSR
jgi:hypothetical protein